MGSSFLALQAAEFQAQRCFYLARSYLSDAKPREGHALFIRTEERASAAIAKHEECAQPDTKAVEVLILTIYTSRYCSAPSQILPILCFGIDCRLCYSAIDVTFCIYGLAKLETRNFLGLSTLWEKPRGRSAFEL